MWPASQRPATLKYAAKFWPRLRIPFWPEGVNPFPTWNLTVRRTCPTVGQRLWCNPISVGLALPLRGRVGEYLSLRRQRSPGSRPTCWRSRAGLRTGNYQIVGTGGFGSLRDISVPAASPRGSGRDRRRTARYLCELRTACVVISLTEPVLLSARVRDISQNGIGLLLPSRVQPGSFLAVKLQGPRDERPRIMRCRVVRIVAQPGSP